MQHDSPARSSTAIKGQQTLMDEDIPLPFDLPAVGRKKVSAAFDGGRITSDGGVMLLAQAERRLGIADQLARVIPDERRRHTCAQRCAGEEELLKARARERGSTASPPPACRWRQNGGPALMLIGRRCSSCRR